MVRELRIKADIENKDVGLNGWALLTHPLNSRCAILQTDLRIKQRKFGIYIKPDYTSDELLEAIKIQDPFNCPQCDVPYNVRSAELL